MPTFFSFSSMSFSFLRSAPIMEYREESRLWASMEKLNRSKYLYKSLKNGHRLALILGSWQRSEIYDSQALSVPRLTDYGRGCNHTTKCFSKHFLYWRMVNDFLSLDLWSILLHCSAPLEKGWELHAERLASRWIPTLLLGFFQSGPALGHKSTEQRCICFQCNSQDVTMARHFWQDQQVLSVLAMFSLKSKNECSHCVFALSYPLKCKFTFTENL